MQKDKSAYLHKAIWLIIMNMKIKMKIYHIDPIYRTTARYGHKYIKYKNWLITMMLIYIKQRLSNVWSSIHGKINQHWGWVEKRVAYIKASIFKSIVMFTFSALEENYSFKENFV